MCIPNTILDLAFVFYELLCTFSYWLSIPFFVSLHPYLYDLTLDPYMETTYWAVVMVLSVFITKMSLWILYVFQACVLDNSNAKWELWIFSSSNICPRVIIHTEFSDVWFTCFDICVDEVTKDVKYECHIFSNGSIFLPLIVKT